MYLNNHSYYSLRYGTLKVEQLVNEAARMGIEAMALTDINNSMGTFDFVKSCHQNGIQPIAGMEFRDGDRLLYTCIARNNRGFQEINEFLSIHNIQKKRLPDNAPEFNHTYVIYPAGSQKARKLRDNEYIGIQPSQVRRLVGSSFSREIPRMVIQQPVTFIDEHGHTLHKNLRAIDHNTLISKLTRGQYAPETERLLPPDHLLKTFEAYRGIIKNTEKLVADCSFEFDFQSYKNKSSFTGTPYDDKLLLEKLAWDGLKYRYGNDDQVAVRRMKHELDIIDKLGFSSYFLITWDIIRYSMSRGFYHVGRGSGANSVVAYCLRITDVDPIELDLYFERFINPKRTNPPDFDIDYSWKERDEVLEYIFRRYGRHHTALLGATSTFRGKSVLRELGKVYGLPKSEIDALVEEPGAAINRNEVSEKIFSMGVHMMDYPNIRSIHAGGVLVSEEPITCYTALDMPPKGFPTTQWDMYVAEDIGFEKLDILSQRGIGHIRDAAELVEKNRKQRIDVHRVNEFKEDPKVRRQLKSGNTIGCFYIESPAMRGLLNKLRCDNYLGLVAASSIIRPGVARSGMMKEYIQRFHHPNSFEYIHPVMKEQLEETYGVMVYQEDVLKICHHFAGLDLADADVLRRAMSGKHRSRVEFRKIVEKFFKNCKEKGYPDELTKEVWRQIESFAGYSFSKAHSASYAVESFQSLYLKAHYPLEFMVAVINNFGGFYRSWVYVNEARQSGADVQLPCVNQSQYLTDIKQTTVYLGFVHVQNMENRLAKRIVEMRDKYGPYLNMEDLVNRVHPGLEQLIILIRISGLRFTGKGKKELLWEAHMLLNKKPQNNAPTLFYTAPMDFELPSLEQDHLEDAYDEIELLGFPVTMSDFELLKIKYRGDILAPGLSGNVGQTIRMVGNLVSTKYVRTVRKEIMYFGTFLDVEGNFFDTTHFPPSLRNHPFRGRGIYLLKGKIVEEFGFPSMEVDRMAKLPTHPDPRYID